MKGSLYGRVQADGTCGIPPYDAVCFRVEKMIFDFCTTKQQNPLFPRHSMETRDLLFVVAAYTLTKNFDMPFFV